MKSMTLLVSIVYLVYIAQLVLHILYHWQCTENDIRRSLSDRTRCHLWSRELFLPILKAEIALAFSVRLEQVFHSAFEKMYSQLDGLELKTICETSNCDHKWISCSENDESKWAGSCHSQIILITTWTHSQFLLINVYYQYDHHD